MRAYRNLAAVQEKAIPQFLSTPEAINALILCLRNLLPLHNITDPLPGCLSRYSPPRSPVLPPRRPVIEKLALRLLGTVLHLALPIALRAGVVSEWLKFYPFPCAQSDNPDRVCDLVDIFQTWWPDDPLMAEVLGHIARDPTGRAHLRDAGLMKTLMRGGPLPREAYIHDYRDEDLQSVVPSVEDDSDVSMVDGEDTAGAAASTSITHRLPRARTQLNGNSAEEQALRRRRREAVVVSDGNAPLGRENIIEPPRDRFHDERPVRYEAEAVPQQHHDSSQPNLQTPLSPASDPQQPIWAGLEGLRGVMGEGELEVDSDEDNTSGEE